MLSSHISKAIGKSCVTKIIVTSRFLSISISSLLEAGSKFELGSSNTINSGFIAITLAIATFFFDQSSNGEEVYLKILSF